MRRSFTLKIRKKISRFIHFHWGDVSMQMIYLFANNLQCKIIHFNDTTLKVNEPVTYNYF